MSITYAQINNIGDGKESSVCQIEAQSSIPGFTSVRGVEVEKPLITEEDWKLKVGDTVKEIIEPSG